MTIYVLIGSLGLLTGFLSGLLGIGGGIIMAPLLLFVPPLIGFDPLPMSVVAGLTIIQGLVASVSGTASHHRNHTVSVPLTRLMGLSIFVAALVGGAGAKVVPNDVLLFLFSVMAIFASVLMLVQPGQEEEFPNVDELRFSRWKAIVAAGSVGILGGLVGQGGSFILIPLMIYFVGIPARIAIGSNLAIVTLSSAAGFIGKAATGQIEWLLAIPIVLMVIPATRLGSYISHKTPVLALRRLLALLIAMAACRMWWSLLVPV
jgi:uncharacterized membrane protein YfcA